MYRTFLRSKIHRATVTQADLNYEGSITVDVDLLEAAGIAPLERVEVYNITNGNRLATYAIAGERGAGNICMNGAAARLIGAGDMVIVCCYCELGDDEVGGHQATVVLVDGQNRIKEVFKK